jgi:hypothetical protein
MVAHEAVRMDKPSIAIDYIGKSHEKGTIVLSVSKNILPGIPP